MEPRHELIRRRWRTQELEMHAQVVTLTPSAAKALLEKNIDNRPLSSVTVSKYASAIIRGEWQLNGEPIIIFEDGTLANGQHRCSAVVKAGIPIQTLIVYGASKSSFATIDAGKSRNASDVLAISGEKSTNVLSSAARAYIFEFLQGRAQYEITSTQILECVESHPHIIYWVRKHGADKAKKILPSAFCGILAIASERYGIEKMEKFFDQVVSGINLGKTDPAYLLRERLLNQTKSSQLSALVKRAFIVKSVNAYVMGKKISFLRLKEGEEMPKVI